MTERERRWAYWTPKAVTFLTAMLILIDADIVTHHVWLAYGVSLALAVAASTTIVMLAKGYPRGRSVV